MNKEPKCPKCGNKNIEIIEHTDAYMIFSKDDNFKEGYKDYGYLDYTTGKCMNCKHIWKFKNKLIRTDYLNSL